MKIKVSYQLLFVVFVVLGLYYPALFADFASIDDMEMVNHIENLPLGSVWDLFRPGGEFYYRPVLISTFVLDRVLWGMHPGFMHLENILLHAVNALLVFFVARKVFSAVFLPHPAPAWVSALLFAVHPIQTESVNWVSGRTDPLATLFVLASLFLLISALESRRALFLLGSALLFLVAVMSKEMSLFFLPIALFIIWRWPIQGRETVGTRRRFAALFAGPFAAGGLIYLFARIVRFGTDDPGLNHVLNHFAYGPGDSVRVFFKVFGFYIKKLFVPLPLNFAIVSASDHYIWLGLIAVVLMVVLAFHRDVTSDFLLASFFLVLPAILIALTNVAWTPLAERYLYLPSAFWCIGVIGICSRALRNVPRGECAALFVVSLLLGSGWVTFERNLIWQSNLSLFQDTVGKSPDYPPARNDLAIALMAEGRTEEAREQLKIAQRLDPGRKIMNVHYNEVHVLLREEKFQEAAVLLEKLLTEEDKPSLKFLQDVARVYEGLLLKTEDEKARIGILDQLEPIYLQIHRQTHDPFIRYRQAQLAMFRGDDATAGIFFREAYDGAPDTAHYKRAARILAEKMTGK